MPELPGSTGRGYYDNVIFAGIIPDFMVQGGDPTGTGRGGESIYGGKFQDEITRELKHTGAGILSMANAGPNTNGSQFFITLAHCPHLDGKHTVFGRISSGMTTVQRLGLARTDANDRPIDPARIVSAEPAGPRPALWRPRRDLHRTPRDCSFACIHAL